MNIDKIQDLEEHLEHDNLANILSQTLNLDDETSITDYSNNSEKELIATDFSDEAESGKSMEKKKLKLSNISKIQKSLIFRNPFLVKFKNIEDLNYIRKEFPELYLLEQAFKIIATSDTQISNFDNVMQDFNAFLSQIKSFSKEYENYRLKAYSLDDDRLKQNIIQYLSHIELCELNKYLEISIEEDNLEICQATIYSELRTYQTSLQKSFQREIHPLKDLLDKHIKPSESDKLFFGGDANNLEDLECKCIDHHISNLLNLSPTELLKQYPLELSEDVGEILQKFMKDFDFDLIILDGIINKEKVLSQVKTISNSFLRVGQRIGVSPKLIANNLYLSSLRIPHTSNTIFNSINTIFGLYKLNSDLIQALDKTNPVAVDYIIFNHFIDKVDKLAFYKNSQKNFYKKQKEENFIFNKISNFPLQTINIKEYSSTYIEYGELSFNTDFIKNNVTNNLIIKTLRNHLFSVKQNAKIAKFTDREFLKVLNLLNSKLNHTFKLKDLNGKDMEKIKEELGYLKAYLNDDDSVLNTEYFATTIWKNKSIIFPTVDFSKTDEEKFKKEHIDYHLYTNKKIFFFYDFLLQSRERTIKRGAIQDGYLNFLSAMSFNLKTARAKWDNSNIKEQDYINLYPNSENRLYKTNKDKTYFETLYQDYSYSNIFRKVFTSTYFSQYELKIFFHTFEPQDLYSLINSNSIDERYTLDALIISLWGEHALCSTKEQPTLGEKPSLILDDEPYEYTETAIMKAKKLREKLGGHKDEMGIAKKMIGSIIKTVWTIAIKIAR